jgi:hypothetical protein
MTARASREAFSNRLPAAAGLAAYVIANRRLHPATGSATARRYAHMSC